LKAEVAYQDVGLGAYGVACLFITLASTQPYFGGMEFLAAMTNLGEQLSPMSRGTCLLPAPTHCSFVSLLNMTVECWWHSCSKRSLWK